jgi:uncharacterized protein
MNMTDDTLPTSAPSAYHLLAKPSGSTCNIDCAYCFFLSKEALYPNEKNRMSDATLEAYFGRHLLCMHAPTCGCGPALEYNGELYSCDHFVEPLYRLGNIHQTHLLKLVASQQQRKFGDDKRDTLTPQCLRCEVKPLCNGGCAKDRFVLSRDGDSGQNYLCPGMALFFAHTRPAMQAMAGLLQQDRAPSEVMKLVAAEDARRGLFQPCPCGSGRKFRFCHGDRAPSSPFSKVNPEMVPKQQG